MHGTLCDSSTAKALDDSSDKTSNSSRSTITSDSILKPPLSLSEALSEALKRSRGACKPYSLPVKYEEKPPQLSFHLLFFAHVGWGPKLSPELRSITNGGQPYFTVPRSRCFWQQLIPYVYESLSGGTVNSLTIVWLPHIDNRLHKPAHDRQRIGGLARPIHMGGCCVHADADSVSAALWEVF